MKDFLVQSIAYYADDKVSPQVIDVILNVNGLLLSGTVVGPKEFWDSHTFSRSLWKGLEELDDERPQEADANSSEGAKIDDKEYIHLKNAHYFLPSGGQLPSDEFGVYMRVRIEQVSSFNFGRFTRPSRA